MSSIHLLICRTCSAWNGFYSFYVSNAIRLCREIAEKLRCQIALVFMIGEAKDRQIIQNEIVIESSYRSLFI